MNVESLVGVSTEGKMTKMVFHFKNVAHNHTHYHSSDNTGLLTASIVADVFLRMIMIIIVIVFTILTMAIMKRGP